MGKEETHFVLKRADCIQYLTKEENDILIRLQEKICDSRKKDGKNPNNKYYICNLDEPYSKSIWSAILIGEEWKKKQLFRM